MERGATTKVAVLLTSFLLVGLTCVIVSLNEMQLQRIMTASHSAFTTFATQISINAAAANGSSPAPSPPPPAFRLLIGILTLPDNYQRRNIIRLVYGSQKPKISQIDVKFVFCNLTKEEQRVLVALEIMRFDDIIILNCTENMNSGKTFTFFSSLPNMLDSPARSRPPPYDYIMKADDDIFFRLNRLEESLVDKPREDMYYGFVIPCDSMDPFDKYMSGMGYILSWDLVEFVTNSSFARNHSAGPEDMMTGEWLSAGGVAKHRYNNKPAMYDYPIPVPIDSCSHDFIPDTIAVHRLKDHAKWVRTLKYFNFTDNLKPSKLYHIP